MLELSEVDPVELLPPRDIYVLTSEGRVYS